MSGDNQMELDVPMFLSELTDEELRFIAMYRNCTDDDKKIISDLINSYSNKD